MQWLISVTMYSALSETVHDIADSRSVWEIARDLGILLAACHGVHKGVKKVAAERNRKRRKRQ